MHVFKNHVCPVIFITLMSSPLNFFLYNLLSLFIVYFPPFFFLTAVEVRRLHFPSSLIDVWLPTHFDSLLLPHQLPFLNLLYFIRHLLSELRNSISFLSIHLCISICIFMILLLNA